mgnify:FL=1
MKYSDIISKVSEELNLPRELVENAYKAYWNFIRVTIEELPLKTELTQVEYGNLRTNINIPSLGKFNCTYNRYMGIRNRFNIINKIRQKQ